MALEVEDVIDGGMGGQESLSRARRFEPLELPFAAPDQQMRILCPIVLSQPLLVPRTHADISESGRVGSQALSCVDGPFSARAILA
jgi:hypothetical protein